MLPERKQAQAQWGDCRREGLRGPGLCGGAIVNVAELVPAHKDQTPNRRSHRAKSSQAALQDQQGGWEGGGQRKGGNPQMHGAWPG